MEGNYAVNTVSLSSCSNGRVVGDVKLEEYGSSGGGGGVLLMNGDGVGLVEPPRIGMVFASQEEVRNYYEKYAQSKGFGIMRRSSRCDDNGRLTYFVLACSHSGKGRADAAKSRCQWRQTVKTNCKAKINVVLDAQGQFHVCNIILDHNHELTPGKLHRSICKKSRGIRMKRKHEGKEQGGGTMFSSDPCSIFGDSLGCENLASAEDSLRHSLAKRAVALVKSGMVIGLGTGTTSGLIIEELGKLIREGKLKDIVAVGANYHSRVIARQFGMATVDINDVSDIDIAFDVVDEVDLNKNILKCSGGSHTVQKIIDSMAKVCIILAEHTKIVHQIGSKIPVAVEVLPIAVSPVLRRLMALGGVPQIRSALRKDGSVITDLGNMIIDVGFPSGIQNPAELEKNINMIPGVVDNGIFSGVAKFVLVAAKDGGGNIRVMNLEEYVEVVLGWRNPSSTL